jgi:8-oxo-dGTP pyrophosphatase MutT (NUDIX family)
MTEIVTIVGLLHYENEVFLMTCPQKWKGYGLPGGKPEPGEDEETTLRREIRQELGIEIADLVKAEEIVLPPSGQIGEQSTFRVKPYFARALSKEIIPSSEVGEYGWYAPREGLKLKLLGPIRKTLEDYCFKYGF